jgi:transcriptional regulator with XRE-family HTH domain
MAETGAASAARSPRAGLRRAQAIDRHVGARVRERRVLLGLTQQQAAELVGVTYQQWHKYEKGHNRIAAGRLFAIAQALGVEVGHLFAGLDEEGAPPPSPTPQQRRLMELTRHFAGLVSRGHQEALSALARALAGLGPGTHPEAGDGDAA